MHRALSSPPKATKILVILLILGAAAPAWAEKCLFYTTKRDCQRYTDSGSCRWNSQAQVCLSGGPSLPPGTVGVALVSLDPESAPLELKPGPSSSFGNVSLVNGSEVSVKFQKEKVLTLDSANNEVPLPEGEKNELSNNVQGLIMAAEAPQPEGTDLAVFCSLPPVIGRCRGFLRRWYWDADTRKCVEFTYGGCGGNDNNFGSKQQCELSGQASC